MTTNVEFMEATAHAVEAPVSDTEMILAKLDALQESHDAILTLIRENVEPLMAAMGSSPLLKMMGVKL